MNASSSHATATVGPVPMHEAVVFLASSRASFVTGQVLHANGGGFMA